MYLVREHRKSRTVEYLDGDSGWKRLGRSEIQQENKEIIGRSGKYTYILVWLDNDD